MSEDEVAPICFPILVLRQYIAECSARISPTKAGELGRFSESTRMSIEFTHDKKFRIRVNLASNTILLPIGALNYLWCATYLFIALFQSYVAAEEEGKRVLDTASDPVTAVAVDLFNWASKDLTVGELKWPENWPRPSLSHQPEDSIHLTNEVFLAALAWILHHERAHVELGHQGNSAGAESIRQEMDADRSASEWVLDGCKDQLEREKRALGIATGFLAMALLDSPKLQTPEVKSHPPDIERLLTNLEIAQLDPESKVYAYSLIVLQFGISQYDPELAKGEWGAEASAQPFEEIFRDLAIRFLRRHRA